MTDARMPERYLTDRRILRLTDAERNSYLMATLWSVSNRTDGHLDRDDIQFVPTFTPDSITALTSTGLWVEQGNGWTDTEFEKVQTSRDDLEVLDNARRADREKKARLTAHKKGDHSRCYTAVCEESGPTFTETPGDFPGEPSRGEHRRGKDRQGQARDYRDSMSATETVNEQTGEISTVPSWPVAQIPQGDPGYCGVCGGPLPCARSDRKHSAARAA